VGLRETLNENPRLTTGLTAAMIVLVLGYIVWSFMGGETRSAGAGASGGRQAYFTDDDGKTYFADDLKKVPPFDHNGKQAVRARVYKANGKEFVNHLERFTPEAKKKVEAVYNSGKPNNDPTVFESIQQSGMEVKNPGDAKWTKMGDPAALKIIQLKQTSEDVEEASP
jgi:hypothetical protein